MNVFSLLARIPTSIPGDQYFQMSPTPHVVSTPYSFEKKEDGKTPDNTGDTKERLKVVIYDIIDTVAEAVGILENRINSLNELTQDEEVQKESTMSNEPSTSEAPIRDMEVLIEKEKIIIEEKRHIDFSKQVKKFSVPVGLPKNYRQCNSKYTYFKGFLGFEKSEVSNKHRNILRKIKQKLQNEKKECFVFSEILNDHKQCCSKKKDYFQGFTKSDISRQEKKLEQNLYCQQKKHCFIGFKKSKISNKHHKTFLKLKRLTEQNGL